MFRTSTLLRPAATPRHSATQTPCSRRLIAYRRSRECDEWVAVGGIKPHKGGLCPTLNVKKPARPKFAARNVAAYAAVTPALAGVIDYIPIMTSDDFDESPVERAPAGGGPGVWWRNGPRSRGLVSRWVTPPGTSVRRLPRRWHDQRSGSRTQVPVPCSG
jgi:hypothetical protein